MEDSKEGKRRKPVELASPTATRLEHRPRQKEYEAERGGADDSKGKNQPARKEARREETRGRQTTKECLLNQPLLQKQRESPGRASRRK